MYLLLSFLFLSVLPLELLGQGTTEEYQEDATDDYDYDTTTTPSAGSAGHIGFDSAAEEVISEAQFRAISAAGLEYFIGKYFDGSKVSDFNSVGGLLSGVHYNGIESIKNAKSAGITRLRDVYHIPRFTDVSPLSYMDGQNNVYAQARIPIDELNSRGAFIGRTWLVILQDVGSGWSFNKRRNEAFISEFVRYFPKLGPQIGILTTAEHYWQIVRRGFVIRDSNDLPLQLWWSNCQTGRQDYSNFVPFNSWNYPVMHRYQCGKTNIGDAKGVNGSLNWFA